MIIAELKYLSSAGLTITYLGCNMDFLGISAKKEVITVADENTRECTFSEIRLNEVFIDPILPNSYMRKTVAETLGHVGSYVDQETGIRYGAGANKIVLKIIKKGTK